MIRRILCLVITLVSAFIELVFGVWTGFASLVLGFMVIGLAFIWDFLDNRRIIWEMILWITSSLLVITLIMWLR